MNETLPLKEWLNTAPLNTEIRLNEDGSAYIPVEYIKPKLDYLSPNWNTENFSHFFYTLPDGRLFCSANVELVIEYPSGVGMGMVLVSRRLSGSATFDVQRYHPNTNWGQTALSLSIVAAAKELGNFFGKELNKDIITEPTDTRKAGKANDRMANTIKNLSKINS